MPDPASNFIYGSTPEVQRRNQFGNLRCNQFDPPNFGRFRAVISLHCVLEVDFELGYEVDFKVDFKVDS